MSSFLAFDLGASSGRAIVGKITNGRMELAEVHRFPNAPVEKTATSPGIIPGCAMNW